MNIKLPQYMWYDPREVEYALPDEWDVSIHNIAGYDRPSLKSGDIRDALASPVGMPPLREIAAGRKEAVILFDDLTRSTRAYEIVPHVLGELHAAGFTDDRIRFIAAVANHQALDRISMAKKLGEDIVARYNVYNHCPFMNCTDLGTSSYGTPVKINSEVMYCDLKIGISQMVPHPQYSFSGCAKIMVPGVAGYETVVAHHGHTHEPWKQERIRQGLRPMGVVDGSPINADAREMAALAGLDMTINCIVNMWGETVELYAGALEPTFEVAVKAAKKQYISSNTADSDIVIANAFLKAAESTMAWGNALPAVKREGGDVVIVGNSPSGQDIHYLFDNFGKTITGGIPRSLKLPPHINNLILYSEYPEARILDKFPDKDKVFLMSDWGEVIEKLKGLHGEGAKVAVYPSADIQYFPD